MDDDPLTEASLVVIAKEDARRTERKEKVDEKLQRARERETGCV